MAKIIPFTKTYTRHIHEKILANPKLTGFQKVYLSVLSSSSINGICELTNKELARRVNIYSPPKEDYIRQTNKNLEEKGFLKREIKGNRRTLLLTDDWTNLGRGKYDLIVDIVHNSQRRRFSYEKMIAKTHLRVFKMTWTRRSNLLSTSVTNLKNHKGSTPPNLSPQTYPPIYKENLLDSMEMSSNKYFINKLIKYDNEVSQPHVSVIIGDSSMEDSSNPPKRKFGFKKQFEKRAATKLESNVCAEVDDIWNKFENLASHRRGTQTYQKAKKYIFHLARGEFRKIGDSKKVIEKLKSSKLSPSKVVPMINKHWDKEERQEIYRRLNSMRRPGSQWAKYMPKDLPSLIYNERTGMSWFIFAALYQERKPIIDEEIFDYTRKMHKYLTYPDLYKEDDEKLIRAVKELQGIHEEFLEELGGNGYRNLREFSNLIQDFLEFLMDRYKLWESHPSVDVTPGWFSPNSMAFSRYREWCFQTYGRRREMTQAEWLIEKNRERVAEMQREALEARIREESR